MKDKKKGFLSMMVDKFDELVGEEQTLVELVEYTTEDGKTIKVASLEVDAVVMLINEDGEESPLEVGTYVIVIEENKHTIVIEEEGVIASVSSDEDEEEEVVEEESPSEELAKDNKDKFGGNGPSAWLELPVGVHTIGGKIYTVEEVIEDEGTENAYTSNIIVSIEDGDSSEEVEEVEEETELSVEKEEVSKEVEKTEEKFSNKDVNAVIQMYKNLEVKFKALETKLDTVSYADTLDTKIEFESVITSNKKKGKLSELLGR